jgi:hypothetical protein
MTTQAQAEANRRNAQKSTGPRTPEGKAASRVNGVRHGLRCQKVLVTDEDPAAYLEHRRGMLRRLQPADALEQRLADRIISLSWRLERADWMEAAYMNRDLGRARHIAQHEVPKELRIAWDDEPDSCLVGLVLGEAMSGPANSYETLRRYERTAERGLYAAIREWRTLWKERRGDAENCGFRISDCGLKTGSPDDVATAQASALDTQCEAECPPSANPKSEIRNPQSPPGQDDTAVDPGSPQASNGPDHEESCRANPIWDPASNHRNSCYQSLFRRAAEAAAARERGERSQSGRRRRRGRQYPFLAYKGVEPDPEELRQWWEEMEEDLRSGKPVVDFCVWKAGQEKDKREERGEERGGRGDAERNCQLTIDDCRLADGTSDAPAQVTSPTAPAPAGSAKEEADAKAATDSAKASPNSQ